MFLIENNKKRHRKGSLEKPFGIVSYEMIWEKRVKISQGPICPAVPIDLQQRIHRRTLRYAFTWAHIC